MEFLIPSTPGGISSATLVLQDQGGYVSSPWPSVTNEVSWYDADLDVNLADFGDLTHLIATFDTDWNVPSETFRFDVSKIVKSQKGKPLGFHVNIQGFGCAGVNGDDFGSNASETGPVLEIQKGGRQP